MRVRVPLVRLMLCGQLCKRMKVPEHRIKISRCERMGGGGARRVEALRNESQLSVQEDLSFTWR